MTTPRYLGGSFYCRYEGECSQRLVEESRARRESSRVGHESILCVCVGGGERGEERKEEKGQEDQELRAEEQADKERETAELHRNQTLEGGKQNFP